MKQNKKNQKGFTLIELIIVIAIMGILAAVLVPSFTQMTAKARVSTDLRSIQTLQKQLELYVAEHDNKYPTEVGGASNNAITALKDGEYIQDVTMQSGADIVLIGTPAKAIFKLEYTVGTGATKTDKILGALNAATSSEKELIILDTVAATQTDALAPATVD